jgi:hypothetical protein
VYGEIYRYLKDFFEKNKKEYHEYGFYIVPDSQFRYRVQNTDRICLPLNAEWKADFIKISDEFRIAITNALPKDLSLNLIYREIIKKAKDTEVDENGLIIT